MVTTITASKLSVMIKYFCGFAFRAMLVYLAIVYSQSARLMPTMEAKGYYDDNFEVSTYLDLIVDSLMMEFSLECLNECFSAIDSGENGLTVLDYGCGPNLANHISAASKATEIVLADYCKPNRDFTTKWLAADPSAHDWSFYFKHVVETLEGKSHQESIERQKLLRDKVKAVVACDITKDQFIEEGYEGPYDVVISSLCLSNAATNTEEYISRLSKIASLVKLNGTLLYSDVTVKSAKLSPYMFGGKEFKAFNTSAEGIVSTLRMAGFSEIVVKDLKGPDKTLAADETYTFLSAKKTQ